MFQNTGSGEFNFLFFEIKAPRWLWLLGVFAGGFCDRLSGQGSTLGQC
jgi:uncharacterized integral membrane protein